MGLWYGSEIITHHETEAYETVYDSCVVVHLADVNEVSFALFIPLYQSISTPSRPANTFRGVFGISSIVQATFEL